MALVAPQFVAFIANVLAAAILEFLLDYGVLFKRRVYVHVDERIYFYRMNMECLFVGDCYPVDVGHRFWNSHIILAFGGVLVASFTIWAYAQGAAYLGFEDPLRRACSTEPTTHRVALSGNEKKPAQASEPRSADQRDTRPLLFIALISALSCVSALALFAPHKTTFEVQGPVWSYRTSEYSSGKLSSFIPNDSVASTLSQFHVQSAAVAHEAVANALTYSGGYTHGIPNTGYEYARTVRVGDSIFPGPRTAGIGLNMASFHEYFLSDQGRNASLGYRLGQRRGWLVAPDYKLQSLSASVYGTNVSARCEDVTSHYTTRRWGPNEKCESDRNVDRMYQYRPLRAKLRQFDIVAEDGRGLSVLHQDSDFRHVTPLFLHDMFLDETTDDAQMVVITDDYPDESDSWATTVLMCKYWGSETLAEVRLNAVADSLALGDSIVDVGPMTHSDLVATRLGVQAALQYSWEPLTHVLLRAREKRRRRDEPLDMDIIEGIFTDLAQAYWSLVRQRLEAPLGFSAMRDVDVPESLTGINRGSLRGTYTRLGGARWGLVFPALMLMLPISILVRWVRSSVQSLLARSKKEAQQVQALLQDEEIDGGDKGELDFIPSLELDKFVRVETRVN